VLLRALIGFFKVGGLRVTGQNKVKYEVSLPGKRGIIYIIVNQYFIHHSFIARGLPVTTRAGEDTNIKRENLPA
jgi:hypothetical protein